MIPEGIEVNLLKFSQLFHDGGRYHLETTPLICEVNIRSKIWR